MKKLIVIALLVCSLLVLSGCHIHWGGQTKQESATEKNKPSICLRASYPDVCLRGVALENNNPQACELMEDEYAKQSCLSMIDYDELDGDDGDQGGCKYDSECPAICKGDVKWEQGCNPRKGECVDTFDTDCSAITDTIAGFDFPQTCIDGECVRNEAEIAAQRAELVSLQQEISDNVKQLNAYRQEVNAQKLDANKKCLNALADVTNMFIIDSALRMGGIINSGINYIAKGSSLVSSTTTLTFQNDELIGVTKTSTNYNFGNDIAGAMGDYAGQVTEKMYAITAAEEANQKPPVEDYIAFYCDYNEYLGEVLEVTAAQLDQQVAMASVLEGQINALS
ncbi:hypothetical protein JXA12_04085 [Candidatus Woesearchaeota archaeon]|nr:hypothetical protein [Candidatus Woesearchaeota archaeon]